MVPLFFVSPGQINVQLPSNLVDGAHTLTVHVEGKPEAKETFTVARNAPGLFSTGEGESAIAVATHQNGTLISAHSPARHGEVVTLYGTGLGPYHPEPADGVAVPSNAKYPLADPVKLMTGKQQASPLWAGAIISLTHECPGPRRVRRFQATQPGTRARPETFGLGLQVFLSVVAHRQREPLRPCSK